MYADVSGSNWLQPDISEKGLFVNKLLMLASTSNMANFRLVLSFVVMAKIVISPVDLVDVALSFVYFAILDKCLSGVYRYYDLC